MILRILSFFIRYGDTDYKGAYEALMAFYEGIQDIDVESVLIDTALDSEEQTRLENQALLMAGNNSRREFSGWESALDHYRDRLPSFDLLHLVTSAFQNEYNGFYPLVCREMLEYVQETPHVMLAHIDAFPERVRLFGRSFQTWGCSKFLFARPTDVIALGCLVAPFMEDDFFPDNNSAPFRIDAPLSKNYADYLINWLTGDGLPHGKWHSVFRYSDENTAKFRSKALSILDEHNLSMRIREAGIQLVDYTWWHANREHLADRIPPDELTQVKERNQYLFGSHIVDGKALSQLPYPAKPHIAALLAEGCEDGIFAGKLIDALMAVADISESSLYDSQLVRAGLLMKVGYRFTASQIAWLVQRSENLEQDAVLPISRGLHAMWLARDDLQQILDLRTAEGREGLIVWWWRASHTDAALQELMPEQVLSEPDNSVVQDAQLPITFGLHTAWLARDDLQQVLDLKTTEGRQGLILWWWNASHTDARLQTLMSTEALSEPDDTVEQDAPLPITRGMHMLWMCRDELRQLFNLRTTEGRKRLVIWWFVERTTQRNFPRLMAAKVLDEIAPHFTSHEPFALTRGEYTLWLSRTDLHDAFDVALPEGRQAYREWLRTNDHLDAILHNVQKQDVQDPVSDLTKTHVINNVSARYGYRDSGVNVIGYGRGEFGIGEDVRMAVRALSSAGMEACVPILPLSVAARQEDSSIKGYEVTKPVFRTNLICLPYYETLRLLAATRHDVLDRRYNIAFWQWELSKFPESMRSALELVDEIWASSSFTAEAVRAATDKPVFHMPMVVSLNTPTLKWTRADFALSENDFIFLTVLDGNSSLKRKNPMAVVRAFASAFPQDKDVSLVIKAMNVSESLPHWRSIVEWAARDKRIHLIVDTYSKDKLIGLQSVCDSFVSLHRAEGFGRNIAEAMLLGKPVIVSDYSGNQDFTTEETAFMVPGSIVPLAEDDYTFAEGQVWFEPDVGAAASMLKVCREDIDLRRRKAVAGKAFVSRTFSAENVGASYKKRMDFLK